MSEKNSLEEVLPTDPSVVQKAAERKMSALFSGRKRSSGAAAPHVKFKIGECYLRLIKVIVVLGGVNITEELAVLPESSDQLKATNDEERVSLLQKSEDDVEKEKKSDESK